MPIGNNIGVHKQQPLARAYRGAPVAAVRVAKIALRKDHPDRRVGGPECFQLPIVGVVIDNDDLELQGIPGVFRALRRREQAVQIALNGFPGAVIDDDNRERGSLHFHGLCHVESA